MHERATAPAAEAVHAPAARPPVQRPAELHVGAVDDHAEREADRLTDQVMAALRGAPASPAMAGGSRSIRRAPVAAQSEPLPAVGPEGGPVPADVAERIHRMRPGGRRLEPTVRAEMEGAFSRDLSAVRIHTGPGADELGRALSARAFTTGPHVYFRRGEFDTSSTAGRRLLAHELAHVVQHTQGRMVDRSAVTRSTIVRRKFDPARVRANAHLRDGGEWETHKGPKINTDTTVLVNTAAPQQQSGMFSNTTWYPAVNVGPDDWGEAIGDERRGYIRRERVRPDGRDLNSMLRGLIGGVLDETQQRHPTLNGLSKPDHVNFLYRDALRVDKWNNDQSTANEFAAGFAGVMTKLGRIRAGADYLAASIEHWRQWLHPDDRTMVWDIDLVESDLHERGLGVARVEFRKSRGPNGHQFADDTTVRAMIKPEDKSLERALLGAHAGSAANRINEIVGLTDPDEMLTTIRMEADRQYGTLVEVVQGLAAQNLGQAPRPVKAVFHETLVFAFLAGIDDLHYENVFWHQGRPYLIDADNVLNRNQMHKEASGDIDQSGFGRYYDVNAAATNRDALKQSDNSRIHSKILDAMLDDHGQRVDIAKVLRDAITGKTGRVVPVASRFWGRQIDIYRNQERYRDQNLDASSSAQVMVGRFGRFDAGVGAGLRGVSGENTNGYMYDQAAEKEQQRVDFEAGVIPFYEYEFTTGHVTHNGVHIWSGLTVDQALGEMLDRFDGSGASRRDAGL